MSAPAAMPRADAARLLGIGPDAGPAEVQHAFLRAARRMHPDRLPDAGEAERRAAGIAFARLLQARDAMLVAATATTPATAAPSPRSERSLGNALVVLALLGFLLVGIVTAEQAIARAEEPPAPPIATSGP